MGKEDVTRARDVNEAIMYALPTILAQFSPELRHNERNIAGLCLTGPPGVGKTAAFVSEMQKLGYTTLVLPCGTVDEVLTFQGLPEVLNEEKEYGIAEIKENVVNEEIRKLTGEETPTTRNKILTVGSEKTRESTLTTAWAKPEWIKTLQNLRPEEKCIVIFDDFHFIKGASIMELLTNDREVNGHVLGKRDNIALAFIGNGLEDAAGAQEMLAPVLDRMVSISVEGVNADKWLDWAIEEGNIHELVLSYIQSNKEELFQKGVGVEDPTDRRPGPRGWANFSDQLNAAEQLDNPDVLRKNLPKMTEEQFKRHLEAGRQSKQQIFSDLGRVLRGIVGKEAANKFSAWYRTFQQYPFDEYMKNPHKKIEINPSQLSSVSLNFSYRFSKLLFEYRKFFLDANAKAMYEYAKTHPDEIKKNPAVTGLLSSIHKKVEDNEIDLLTPDERLWMSALTTINDSADRIGDHNKKVYGEYKAVHNHYGALVSPSYALFESSDIDDYLNKVKDDIEAGKNVDIAKVHDEVMKLVDRILGQHRKIPVSDELRKSTGATNLAELIERMLSFALRFSETIIKSSDGASRHRALTTFLSRATASYNARDKKYLGVTPGSGKDTGAKSEADYLIKSFIGDYVGRVFANELGSFAQLKTAMNVSETDDTEEAGSKKRGRRPKTA